MTLSWVPIVFDWEDEVSESFLISSATTEKPFPASPAWAASIAAFIARRLVWDAIDAMEAFACCSMDDWSSMPLTRSLTAFCFVRPTWASLQRVSKESAILSTEEFTEEMFPIIS